MGPCFELLKLLFDSIQNFALRKAKILNYNYCTEKTANDKEGVVVRLAIKGIYCLIIATL